MKRTTIILGADLEQRLKQRARRRGTTMTQLIQSYVREGLRRHPVQKPKAPLDLPVFDMGAATVEPADRNRLWDLMDTE